MTWVRDSDSLLLRAAELKAKHPLSLAVAWIAACALEHNAILVHKDPEFQPLDIPQDLLPLRARVCPSLPSAARYAKPASRGCGRRGHPLVQIICQGPSGLAANRSPP